MQAIPSRRWMLTQNPIQAPNEESIGRTQSDVVLNSNVSEADIDSRLAGAMSVRRQIKLERGRLGGMFAATIVEKM